MEDDGIRAKPLHREDRVRERGDLPQGLADQDERADIDVARALRVPDRRAALALGHEEAVEAEIAQRVRGVGRVVGGAERGERLRGEALGEGRVELAEEDPEVMARQLDWQRCVVHARPPCTVVSGSPQTSAPSKRGGRFSLLAS
jgi:hypothetical protein